VLRPKQQKFVDEYLVDLNATQAALRAGYSEKTAKCSGHENLTKPDIQKAIAERQADRNRRTEVTQDRVLLEIARLAFNDPRKAFNENGELKAVKDWPDEVAAAIQSIKINEFKGADGETVVVKEVKFWDKGKQIDLAARHLGMLNDKLDLKGSVNIIATTLDERV
jgi:phage terminase small subunit